MNRVEQTIAALLADRALEARRVAGVWLFGSEARGTAMASSDVDLAVLCTPPLGIDRFAAIDRTALAVGHEVDLIDLATAAPSLCWEILTTGRLVIERDPLAVEDFLRRARWAAEDDAQRNRMILLAQVGRRGDETR